MILSFPSPRRPVTIVLLPKIRSAFAFAQLEFLSDTGRTDDASKLAAGTEDSLETSADLLGLSIEELTGALLTRPLQVAREKFVKPNKVGEAQSARDALAKDVYLGIFNYLLKKINEATRYVARREYYCCGHVLDTFQELFYIIQGGLDVTSC